jgi:autotransporter-associated beta strand protein
MNANSIGSASATIAFVAASGTLKNLAELNGGGVLDKTTAGTLFLEGTNTYTGGTTVTAGNLAVNNTAGSGTGTGAITVASGATLGGNGFIAPGAGNNILVDGTLAAGSPGRASGEDLSISLLGASTLTLNNTIKFTLFTNAETGTLNGAGSSDLLDVNAPDWNNIIFGTNYILEVATALNTTNWQNGDAWKLFDWSGITSGLAPAAPAPANLNLPVLSGGATWDTSQVFTTGVISVVVVPEPSRALLLLLSCLALVGRRHRKE